MPITPDEARASLAAIDQVTRHIRQTIARGAAAPALIIWGAIWMVAYSCEQFYPRYAQIAWFILIAIGSACSLLWGPGSRRSSIKNPHVGRVGLSWLILFAYAALWAAVLGPWEHTNDGTWRMYAPLMERKLSAFTASVCMFAYTIMGLWLDRFFLWVGAVVTLAILAGYYFVPGYFYLWMAVMGGGSLVVAGLFIRKFWR